MCPFRAEKPGALKRKPSKCGFDLSGVSDEEEEDNEDDEEEEENDEEEDGDDANVLQKKKSGQKNSAEPKELDFMSDYEPTCRTMEVDLNHRDKTGRSLLEIVIDTLPEQDITFDNAIILALLIDAGASIPPNLVELALRRGARRCAILLQSRQGLPYARWQFCRDLPTVDYLSGQAAAALPPLPNDWDCIQDAARHRHQLETDADAQMIALAERYQPAPDKHSQKSAPNCVLLKDDRVQHYFDALLNKVDVAAGQWGLYNFYKLQLLQQKAKSMFFLFTRWGRIGDVGQYQCTPFGTLEEGRKEFDKIYRAKTGLRWIESAGGSKPHEPQSRKYKPVPLDRLVTPARTVPLQLSLKSQVTVSKEVTISPEAKELFDDLLDIDIVSAALRRSKCDERRLPFGRIRRESLQRAAGLLFQDIE